MEGASARRTLAGLSGVVPVAIGAILATVGITTLAFLLAGANPIEGYYQFLVAPLTSQFRLLEVLVASTPLLLAGLAVAIAFRAGYWNIGAEGQLLAGAMAAGGLGMVLHDVPPVVAIPVMILGGALAGAAWALVPALLRVRLGIDEVVTTLLLNPVALLLVKALVQGPWRDPSGITESPPIAETAHFPQLIERSRLHLGFLIAVIGILVAWYVLTRTATGLRVRAVGLAPGAARFAGIRVERTLLRVALVSGAIAGIAGVSEVAGIQYRLTSGLSPGYGYTGVVVAMLGGLTMPGVLLAGLLLGDLTIGASIAEGRMGVPSQMGELIQGVLLLAVVAVIAARSWRSR
ncbi:MAG: ABC transporter permease, partial [Candidatus Limnocylindrales bacterium]